MHHQSFFLLRGLKPFSSVILPPPPTIYTCVVVVVGSFLVPQQLASPGPTLEFSQQVCLGARAHHLLKLAFIDNNSDGFSSICHTFFFTSQFVWNQDGRQVIYFEPLKYSKYWYKAYFEKPIFSLYNSCFLVPRSNHLKRFQQFFYSSAYHYLLKQ